MKTKVAIMSLILIVLTSVIATKAKPENIASWYGGGEKLNRYTANGEEFNPEELTCASWDHPFNTKLKITNITNQKSVVVRVNDRGPDKRLGRAVDLTRAAFSSIADVTEGLVSVTIEKLD